MRRAKPTQVAALRAQATVAVQQGQTVALGFPPCTYAKMASAIATRRHWVQVGHHRVRVAPVMALRPWPLPTA